MSSPEGHPVLQDIDYIAYATAQKNGEFDDLPVGGCLFFVDGQLVQRTDDWQSMKSDPCLQLEDKKQGTLIRRLDDKFVLSKFPYRQMG